MRYALKLKPQGAIPRGVDMDVPLTQPGDGENTTTNTSTTIVVGACEATTVGAWIVENVSIQNDLGGIKTAVAEGVGGEVQRVAFPNNCFRGNIRAALGCLVEGDCIEWAAETNDTTTVTLFPYNGTDEPGERCDGISFLVEALGDPSYDFSATEVTITATLNGDPIGPPIVCYCDAGYFAGLNAWGGWCTQHVDTFAAPCSPTSNTGPTPTPCVDLTIAQFATSGCHIDVTPAGSGNIFGVKPSDVNWTVTQLTGTATPLVVILGVCGHWQVYQANDEDYAGNSFQLDADIASVPYGDPIIITCEV